MMDSLISSPRPESPCSTTNRKKPLSRSLRAKPALERIFSSWLRTSSGLQVSWGGIRFATILTFPQHVFNVIAVLLTPHRPLIACVFWPMERIVSHASFSGVGAVCGNLFRTDVRNVEVECGPIHARGRRSIQELDCAD